MPQSYLFKPTILKNRSQGSSVGTVTRLWGWMIQTLFAGRDKRDTYTGCPRRNVQYFGRVFLMLNYTDITQNTYIQS